MAQPALNHATQYGVELALNDDQFAVLRAHLTKVTGIEIADAKKHLAQSRLARRLRQIGMSDFDDYIALLRSTEGEAELEHFVNTLTTNVTGFFREGHHFDDLAEHITAKLESGATRLRIWSAACSIGAEPYSAALAVHDVLEANAKNAKRLIDLKILATDIDTAALGVAAAGVYVDDQMDGLPDHHRRHFAKTEQGWRISDAVSALVSIRRLNLNDHWPMRGPFDAIFCRNVVIYFGRELQQSLWSRLSQLLADDGRLYIGHAEVARVPNLHLAGRTTYTKLRGGS